MNPEAFIQSIQDRRNQSDENTEDLSTALDDISTKIYAKEGRFLFELIQNACDCSATDIGVDISVFLTKDGHLYFSHNGVPFFEEHVTSLCAYGRSSKKQEEKSIGYKGIGFKSVFSQSSNVRIISGEFDFSFIREHWMGKRVPWQILPIWNATQKLKDWKVEKNETVVVLELHDDTHVEDYLSQLKSAPEFTVFLAGLRTLSVETPNLKFEIEKEVDNGVITIQIDGELELQYLLREFQQSIPSQIRKKLKEDKDLPDKIKEMTATVISFAMPINADKETLSGVQPLYSFFPTKVDVGLEVLVNSSFLTTVSRENLQEEHIWNRYLIEESARCLTRWMAELAVVPLWRQEMLRLLPGPVEAKSDLANMFHEALYEALQEFPCLPNHVGNDLLLSHRAFYDETGISNLLGINSFAAMTEVNAEAMVYSRMWDELKYVDRLQPYQSLLMDYEFLSEIAEQNNDLFKIPENNFRVAEHLSEVAKEPQECDQIKQKAWMLDSRGDLYEPQVLSYYEASGVDPSELPDSMRFIDEILHSALKKSTGFADWMHKLGVFGTGPAELVKKLLIPALKKGVLDTERGDFWLDVLVHALKKNMRLDKNEIQILGGLSVSSNLKKNALLRECWIGRPFVSEEEWKDLAGPPRDQICLLPTQVAKAAKKSENVLKHLKEIGVSMVGLVSFIESLYLPGLKLTGGVTDEDYWISLIFRAHSRSKLTESHYKALRRAQFETQTGVFSPIEECWLGDEYLPSSEWVDFISKLNNLPLLSGKYAQSFGNDSMWLNLLSKIGVRQDISIITQARVARSDLFSGYQKFIEDIDEIDRIYFNYANQHIVAHHQIFNIDLGILVYAAEKIQMMKYFLGKIFSWHDRNVFKSTYLVDRERKPYQIPSYIVYLLAVHPVWPCTDGLLHKANDIVTNVPQGLRSLIATEIPLLDLEDIDIPPEVGSHLKMQDGLSWSQCIDVLKALETSGSDKPANKECIKTLYKIMSNLLSLKKNSSVKEDILLLSESGEFSRANTLNLVSDAAYKEFYSPSERLDTLDLELEEFAQLFETFGVIVRDEPDYEVSTVGPVENTQLKDQILERQYLFSLLATGKSKSHKALTTNAVKEKLNNITFYQVDSYILHDTKSDKEVTGSTSCFIWPKAAAGYLLADSENPSLLYELSQKLAEYLKLDDHVHLIDLLLRLPIADGIERLQSEGYPIELIPDMNLIQEKDEPEINQGNVDVSDEELNESEVKKVMADPAISLSTASNLCMGNDYHTDENSHECAEKLHDSLEATKSPYAGHIYHFTHIENLVRILQNQTLQARARVENFNDSAGPGLIAKTTDTVKNFVRFYFRPHTPTQWHNECLGRSYNGIRALCPVPVFLKLPLTEVIAQSGNKWAVSNGNLAAASSQYGNTVEFLDYFDVDNLYRSIGEVGTDTFLSASQQEFIVEGELDIRNMPISLICRTEQDGRLLKHLLKESRCDMEGSVEISVDQQYFHSENPSLDITVDGDTAFTAALTKARSDMEGMFVLKLDTIDEEESPIVQFDKQISLDWPGISGGSVFYRENDKDWLVYSWKN